MPALHRANYVQIPILNGLICLADNRYAVDKMSHPDERRLQSLFSLIIL